MCAVAMVSFGKTSDNLASLYMYWNAAHAFAAVTCAKFRNSTSFNKQICVWFTWAAYDCPHGQSAIHLKRNFPSKIRQLQKFHI